MGHNTAVKEAGSAESKKDKMKIELPPGVDVKDLIAAFTDPKRLGILDLLSKKEMTISQLGESLDCSPQNAYHHVKKLLDSGMVKLSRTKVDKNYVEKYYSTTVDLDCVGCMLHEIKKKFEIPKDDLIRLKIALLGFAMAKIDKAIRIIEKSPSYEEYKIPWEFGVAINACTIPTSKIEEVLERYNETMESYLEAIEKESQKDEEEPKHAFITVIVPTK